MPKALIVDDSRQIADSMVNMLAFFDIEARPAYGARAALNALKEMTPSIVFLDLNMPGLTGFEVLSYLRREPHLELVPVIVVTSDDQPESAELAMQRGASSYVIKPMTLDVLESTLKTLDLIP
ncbi:MAG: response regulator [Anaerolineales bacterium]|nr:response regulator [Anaerolineales bacterium]